LPGLRYSYVLHTQHQHSDHFAAAELALVVEGWDFGKKMESFIKEIWGTFSRTHADS